MKSGRTEKCLPPRRLRRCFPGSDHFLRTVLQQVFRNHRQLIVGIVHRQEIVSHNQLQPHNIDAVPRSELTGLNPAAIHIGAIGTVQIHNGPVSVSLISQPRMAARYKPVVIKKVISLFPSDLKRHLLTGGGQNIFPEPASALIHALGKQKSNFSLLAFRSSEIFQIEKTHCRQPCGKNPFSRGIQNADQGITLQNPFSLCALHTDYSSVPSPFITPANIFPSPSPADIS